MKAFQLNESNSTTSNIPTEKIRDVEASKNSFYKSLASGMGVAGYTEEELKSYIPCLVYTLYDGYYIYTKNSDGNYILKPYVYYTEKVGEYVVSYTLDSYISVMGRDGFTKSGYLYNNNNDDINLQEELRENVIDNNGTYRENIPYVYKKWENSSNQSLKYYYLDYKWYSLGTDGKLTEETRKERLEDLESNKDGTKIIDTNAKLYKEKYKNSGTGDDRGFTKWVSEELGIYQSALDFKGNNNPDKYSSPFNEHRRKIIQESIKINLEATVVNYFGSSVASTFEFQMPELDETEWDKIINNVSLISFMQGLPLKNKYYRGYSVVTNTESKEFVDPDEIYLLTEKSGVQQYHKITWKGFQIGDSSYEAPLKVAYRNVDFRRKTYKQSDGIDAYYYPHGAVTADYESIVASKNVITADKDNGEENDIEVAMDDNNIDSNARKAYYTALYRERYINYKSLNF